MLRTRPLAATIVLAVALAPTTRAQAPPGPMPGLMGLLGGNPNAQPMMILLAPSVQKELKLTEKQKAGAYDLARAQGQKGRDLAQARLLGGNPQAVMAAGRQLRQETDRAIGKLLDAPQMARLDQIVLQAEGPLAVARPEIAAKLRLNDTQNQYVQSIMMQMRQQLFLSARQSMAAGQFDPAQLRAQASQLRAEAVRALSKVIDRKQKAAFDKMLGEPFDLNKLDSETSSSLPDTPRPADSASTKDEPKKTDDADKDKDQPKEPTKPARKKRR